MSRRALAGVALAAGLWLTGTSMPLIPFFSPPVMSVRAATADEAVAYQVSPSHDGAQPSDSLAPPLTSQWAINLQGRVSFPLIAGNHVYVTVAGGYTGGATLYGFDLASGTQLWPAVDIGSTSLFNNAAYESGHLFILNGNGGLEAIDAASGRSLWFTQLAGQRLFTSAPTALNGTVYTTGGGFGGTLYAVNESDGSVRWTARINNGDHSSPAVNGTGVYVSSACDEAYKFDPLTGHELWHYAASCPGPANNPDTRGGTTPALFNGRLYVRDPSMANNVVLDGATGSVVGSVVSAGPPAFSSSLGYFMSSATALQARNLSSGEVAWSFNGDGHGLLPPILVGGYVYTASWSGTLFALGAASGQQAWSGALASSVDLAPEQSGNPLVGLAAADGMLAIPEGTVLQVFAANATPASPGPPPTVTPMFPPLTVGSSTGQQVAFQVDTNHSGAQLADATVPPLTLKWSRGISAASHPLIVNGHVYLAAGWLSDIVLATGSSGPTIDLGSQATNIAYDAGKIFAINGTGLLRGIDPSTMATVWSRQLPGDPWFSSEPVARNGIVYTSGPAGASGAGGTIYAVNEADGSIRWIAPVVNGVLSAPVVSDTGVYVSYGCGQVYDFDPGTGALIWHHDGSCQSDRGRAPALYRGRLYVRDPLTGNLILDATTGRAVGSFSGATAPAFYGSLGIFLTGMNGWRGLEAVDLDTGFVAWNFTPADGLVTPPIVDNGYVYVAGVQGNVFAVDARTGQAAWSENVGRAFAAPKEDNVYRPVTGFAAGQGFVRGHDVGLLDGARPDTSRTTRAADQGDRQEHRRYTAGGEGRPGGAARAPDQGDREHHHRRRGSGGRVPDRPGPRRLAGGGPARAATGTRLERRLPRPGLLSADHRWESLGVRGQ